MWATCSFQKLRCKIIKSLFWSDFATVIIAGRGSSQEPLKPILCAFHLRDKRHFLALTKVLCLMTVWSLNLPWDICHSSIPLHTLGCWLTVGERGVVLPRCVSVKLKETGLQHASCAISLWACWVNGWMKGRHGATLRERDDCNQTVALFFFVSFLQLVFIFTQSTDVQDIMKLQQTHSSLTQWDWLKPKLQVSNSSKLKVKQELCFWKKKNLCSDIKDSFSVKALPALIPHDHTPVSCHTAAHL